MNISTRLILLLTMGVSLVMVIASFFMLRQRARELETAARNEMRAHAITLQIALEENYASNRLSDAERLIRRLGENTRIYRAILFDKQGQVLTTSHPDEKEAGDVTEALRVIATGESVEVTRSSGKEEIFSIIRPVMVNGERAGVVEIAQPISFVRDEIAHEQRDTIITTLLLLLTIFLIVLLVTHYNLTQPVKALLRGALAVGRGDLDYRVDSLHGSGEFTMLAHEFNRMADSLAEQRQHAAREAEERLNLERQLRHSERLASLGRLAAGIAHEMGAPLQVIDGRARQLLNHQDTPVEVRQRNLTIIRTQTERIARIVRQLLNLARPYHLRLREVDLSQAMAEALELLEPGAAQAQVQLAPVPTTRLMVKADPELLHQVFMNICLNAIQTVSANRQGDGKVSVDFIPDAMCKEGGSFIAVRIVDNGGGIAPEHFASLFDPFFTTREPGQGTGLGLSVSRRIIEEHGGWIEAANNEEGGATFTIYLPESQSAKINSAGQPADSKMNEHRIQL